jgi:thioredoxin 1
MQDLDSSTFKTHIAKGYSVVDFWAPWCGPCRMLGPVIDDLSKEMKSVHFGKVNVDEQSELAGQFQVMSIPTVALFKDGKIVAQRVGAGTKAAMKEWIDLNMGN